MKALVAVILWASFLFPFQGDGSRTKEAAKKDKEFREALASLKPGISMSDAHEALKRFQIWSTGEIPFLTYYLERGSTFHLFFAFNRENRKTHLLYVASFKLEPDGKLIDGRMIVPKERKGEKIEYESLLEMVDKEQMKYK